MGETDNKYICQTVVRSRKKDQAGSRETMMIGRMLFKQGVGEGLSDKAAFKHRGERQSYSNI